MQKITVLLLMSILTPLLVLTACPLAKPTDGFSGSIDPVVEAHNWDSSRKAELDYIFDMEALPTITITVKSNEWNTLLSNYDIYRKNDIYVKADFAFNKGISNEIMTNIGFRMRGNTSRRRPEGETNSTLYHDPVSPIWRNAHFKVNFRTFFPDGLEPSFHSLRGFNLKWFKDDNTYAREVYAYDLFKRFGVWTAPRISYCKVYIKIAEDSTSAYFGVYEMLEPVDKAFIKARFDESKTDDEGALWKCLYGGDGSSGADLVSSSSANFGIQTNTLDIHYQPVYDLKTIKTNFSDSQAQFASFIANLNSKSGDDFKTWIDGAFDVKGYLRGLAVSVLVGGWDNYWGNKQNYYIYFNRDTAKAYFIWYDYDNSLGTMLTYFTPNGAAQNVFTFSVRSESRPLVQKILAIPEYKTMYSNYMVNLLETTNKLFTYKDSIERINTWHAMIRSSTVSVPTINHEELGDIPADWSSFLHYRLLSGDVGVNYFKTRITSAQSNLGIPVYTDWNQ